MKLEFDRPLFVGAHPDDNCLGAGGLMSRLHQASVDFHCYTMTCFDEDRKRNWENAIAFIKPKSYGIHYFLADYLEDHKRELRRILLKIKKEVDPDIVFTHNLKSSIPDHSLLATEVRRLFRYQTVLGYPGMKDEGRFKLTLFFEINEAELEDKVKALSYFTWETKYQDFMQPEAIRAQARMYGIKVGVKYAEAFDLVRMKV